MKKYACFLRFSILLLPAVFLRIYHLAILPLGMHIDEAGLGLNAWSIARFGTDRYGNFLPVCPSNFYGEQSAFYTYFCALLVKSFGLTPCTLRMPAAVMGVLTVLFGALLMGERWGKKGFYTGLALLSIFPYFIMNSRFALDCNAMLGMSAAALYSLVRLLRQSGQDPEKRRYGQFALTGFLFGVVLYTYIIAAIAVALFCALFGIFYLSREKENRPLRLRQFLFLALPLAAMAVLPALTVAVNFFRWEPIVTPFFSIPRTAADRSGDIAFSLSAFSGKLRALLYPLTTDGKYGSLDHCWTMYRWSVPFTLTGAFFSLRSAIRECGKGSLSADACMVFWAFSETVLFLLCGQYNYHINGIFIALAYFCVNGILSLAALFALPWIRRLYGGILFCVCAVSFAGFCREYYGTVPTLASQVYGGVEEALGLLADAQKEGDIYIFDEVGEFYFLSNPIPPSAFLAACDRLGYIRDYQNLHFHEPEIYRESDVYICSKVSGRFYFFSDPTLLGHACSVLETAHYYVFYPAPQ